MFFDNFDNLMNHKALLLIDALVLAELYCFYAIFWKLRTILCERLMHPYSQLALCSEAHHFISNYEASQFRIQKLIAF